ncbi:3-methyl-2-oxobutanoate hydroxymethyltransferase [Streptomyces sp. SL13]|uniref:3-methyl-2-oxobutanoate hydroxymethyltransferase n=1 Tax=Streptantibioticus silvisoli TaxID=2705255 RepID=A0AA90HAE5_9ACTN|nr:3-methyl-2-oxobutanoate hydroxymethyltransferase [Streptantibioticus silvisoli]MDI5973793.1 3-methyl-2-oxobutanoate hydroxymethyltransferase [Streptantibioticus silvisoli]
MSAEVTAPAPGSTLSPYLWRYDAPAQIGLKVNVYRGFEVRGLAQALRTPDLAASPVECLMVGDSYFMTHLGRPSTAMDGPGEQQWALHTLTGLVGEVREAMDAEFPADRRPFLLADLPDGATRDSGAAHEAADRFVAAGADAVKIEVAGARELDCVAAVASSGVPTLAHLGYTPQRGVLGRHGDAVDEAFALFAQARRVRDAGACGLIIEMVSEAVNQALSTPHPEGLPLYSVFSGRARWGGQSLNLWDAVVRPSRGAKYFPPTSVLDAAEVPACYGPELIADRMRELIRLTLAGWFPLTPRTALSPREFGQVADADPWSTS